MDETTELQVKYIKEGKDYNEVLKSLSDFNLYDISFYKDDEKVTIDGVTTVKMLVWDKDPEMRIEILIFGCDYDFKI